MACQLCEHCQAPVSRDERITIREGFSYHKKCHKCYVCSETNLRDAEVFKGVIFCSSCAQRIFQGCSTARRTKTLHNGKMKRPRSRSYRRERTRTQERKVDRTRDGVIELAGLVGSTTDSEDPKKQKHRKSSKPTLSSELAMKNTKIKYNPDLYYIQRMQMKKDSTEMGTTTDVTQELLRQINWPLPECVPEWSAKERTPYTIMPPRKHYKRNELYEPVFSRRPRKLLYKPICSDLRIAELGTSTEIANMALRKKSEVPIIIKSDSRLQRRPSYSLCTLNQESGVSGDGSDWLDSVYSSIEENGKFNVMDRRLGSILKMPINFFKKNILNRSSLISVLMSTESDKRNINIIKRLKRLLYEEIAEHQVRGVRKLYSTINRRTNPYKLGWIDLVAKVPKVIEEQDDVCTCDQMRDNELCVCDKRCSHFRYSHSYRCMRAHVMKLAGPTSYELAMYRNKFKKILSPSFFRKVMSSSNSPAIKMSQACGSALNDVPSRLRIK